MRVGLSGCHVDGCQYGSRRCCSPADFWFVWRGLIFLWLCGDAVGRTLSHVRHYARKFRFWELDAEAMEVIQTKSILGGVCEAASLRVVDSQIS